MQHRLWAIAALGIGTFAFFLFSLSLWPISWETPRFRSQFGSVLSRQSDEVDHHVAIASLHQFHFDVYLAAAKTFQDLVGDRDRVQIFADAPLRFGFEDIVDKAGLYAGDILPTDDLIPSIQRADWRGVNGSMIDIIVLGTCEIE